MHGGEHDEPARAFIWLSVFCFCSVALGQGMRLGFLGLLHMDVFRERLEQASTPNIVHISLIQKYKCIRQYKVKLLYTLIFLPLPVYIFTANLVVYCSINSVVYYIVV